MNTVAKLHDVPEVDIREEQSFLIEAEQAALTALAECSKAGGALVSFLRKTNYSPVHPKVRALLKRYPELIAKISGVSSDLTECHKLTQSLAESCRTGNVVMTGGFPKEEIPEEP